MKELQSNLAIRNFLVTLKLFLNAKCSLSLWSKWQIGHGKWFLNTNLFLIKKFLIAKFDCTTLQFLQFWYQNGVNILFLVVKPIEVTSGFISKLMKKFARWRCCWNIWHLSLKTKISRLIVCYQECNEYQKNQQDLRNSDVEVCCANIQPKLKNLRSSTKNQSFFMVSRGFLKFIPYWLNISALTQQIYL